MLEIAANVTSTASILLAARNSVHTWWTGIIACFLFSAVFAEARLYADVTLQSFFVVTSALGWWHWTRGAGGTPSRVRRTKPAILAAASVASGLVIAGYGLLLQRFTDAYAPFLDSAILAFSVVGQILLMLRRYETWCCWILVDTIAVPLFAVRGLHLTAVLYAGYWINAAVALWRWRRWLHE